MEVEIRFFWTARFDTHEYHIMIDSYHIREKRYNITHMTQEEFRQQLFSLRTRGEIKRFAKSVEKEPVYQQYMSVLLMQHGIAQT